jgi:Protein of unknown function (DUF1822)
MFSPVVSTNSFRVLFPEAIELEPHYFEQARELSHGPLSEALQWQAYVNALAFLGFTQWLSKKMPEQVSSLDPVFVEQPTGNFVEGCHFKIGDFKLCLTATEHVLDEVVLIPQRAILNSDLAAHFYVAIEVCLEEAQILLRGILRNDQLQNHLHQGNRLPTLEGCYSIPLALFDPEPNHLLSYCRYLDAIAISLPVPSSEIVTTSATTLQMPVQDMKTKLGHWLQDRFEEGWLAIDILISPEMSLAFNTRNANAGIRRGKLLNLGVKLGQQSVVLLISINPEPEEKLNILVQLHPTGVQKFLPSNIMLKLQSKSGNSLQEVQARSQDNYIQLQPFKGTSGQRFSLEVGLFETFVKEDFEL